MSSVTLVSQVPGDTKHASVSVTAAPSQAATAFADLLDKPEDGNKKQAKKQPEHPAYSFAELGMFGLHAVQDADDSQKVTATATSTAHAKTAAADKEKKNAAGTTSSKSATAQPLVYVPYIYGEVAATAAPVDTTPAPAGFASVSAAMPAKPAASSSKSVTSNAAPQQPKADSNQKLMEQAAQQKTDDVSVTVAGPDEGLKIAARGPSGPATEVVKLRRLIEATVAHFEMDIAELHFNGNALDSAFSLGGMNGGIGG